MRGAGIPVEASKAEAWPGQHEITFRYGDPLTVARQPRDLQARRQGDRRPERALDHVHGQARPPVDRQLLPRPHEPLAGRPQRLRGRIGRLPPLPRGPGRLRGGARRLRGARRQLVQAVRREGHLGGQHHDLGARQPHDRFPRRRPRERAANRGARPGRRLQPLPGFRGPARRRAPRHREPARAAAALRGQRLRARRRARVSPRPSARRSRRSSRARWPGPPSATPSSTTT